MSPIDTPTLVNWIVQGSISLVFGVLGGYVGSWVQYRFTQKLERERERRALRSQLTEGVSKFVEARRRAELNPLAVLKRFSLNLLALAGVVLAFVVSPWAGLTALFVFGLLLGAQARA